MSLIYEALRKSEEQRRLGEAPTLSTPTVFAVRRRRRVWPIAVALVALVAVGATAWWLGRASLDDDAADARVASTAADDATGPVPATPAGARPTPPPPPRTAASYPPTAAPAVPPAVAAPAPTTAGDADARAGLTPEMQRKLDGGEVFANSPELLKPSPPTPAPAYVPPEAALPQPLPDAENASPESGAPPTAAVAPPPAAAPPAQPAQVIPLPDGAAPPAAAPAPAPPEPVAGAPAAAAPNVPATTAEPAASAGPIVPYVFELPLATRRELPALKLNMHVYSADRARRFVIVDGTRAGEGGTLTGDVSVVEIRGDDVILEFRGQRFLLPRGG